MARIFKMPAQFSGKSRYSVLRRDGKFTKPIVFCYYWSLLCCLCSTVFSGSLRFVLAKGSVKTKDDLISLPKMKAPGAMNGINPFLCRTARIDSLSLRFYDGFPEPGKFSLTLAANDPDLKHLEMEYEDEEVQIGSKKSKGEYTTIHGRMYQLAKPPSDQRPEDIPLQVLIY